MDRWTLRFLCISLCTFCDAILLDVGAPRTGTQSMYTAFRILGLNPLHSGYHPHTSRPPVCKYVLGDGGLENVLALLNGFDVAMDEPFMLIYEEVLAAFPDAKFILTIKEKESWYQNYWELLQEMQADAAIVVKNDSSKEPDCVLFALIDWWFRKRSIIGSP
eukprot:g26372.t1